MKFYQFRFSLALKGVQYQDGSLVSADENGELYTGIVVFMVVSLKKSVPFAIKACPESRISGDWLSLQIEETLRTILNAAFNVWAVMIIMQLMFYPSKICGINMERKTIV